MTRAHWPSTLDEVLAEPVTPHCPLACIFRELCPTHVQVGIVTLFQDATYAGPQDCLYWQKMAVKVREEIGGVELPIDAAGLRLHLRRLRGL